MSKKSIFGLNENLAGAISYLGIFVSGIIVLILEKENQFVRFCALQSTVLFLALGVLTTIVKFVIGWVPLIGGLITGVIGLISFAAWAYLSYTAYKGQMFKVPVLGDICWEQVNK